MVLSTHSSMNDIFIASVVYFAIVFGCAFVLGAFRVLVLLPWLEQNELVAVLWELPLILTISWKACHYVFTKYLANIDRSYSTGILMGITSFVLLQLAEWGLSVVGFGQALGEFWREIVSSPAKIVGLLGQVLYACFPVFMIRQTAQPQRPSSQESKYETKTQ